MQGCGIAAALLIGIMTVLVGYDVLARNIGLPAPAGIAEASEYGLALTTLAGRALAAVVRGSMSGWTCCRSHCRRAPGRGCTASPRPCAC